MTPPTLPDDQAVDTRMPDLLPPPPAPADPTQLALILARMTVQLYRWLQEPRHD